MVIFFLARMQGFYATLVRFIPARLYALPGSSRFNNRKLGTRLVFDLCSKADPWKYLRGSGRPDEKYLASRLETSKSAGENSAACEPYNIELYEVR